MATIRKRLHPSGKSSWQVDYRDAAGARRHRQFETKREADAFMVRARAEVAAGTHTPDAIAATVAAAAAMWIARCERDRLELSTLRAYQRHVDNDITPRIGTVKLSRLSVPAINAFVDQMRADGRSADMTKRVLRSLSAIVQEAQRRGLVAANNVREAQPPRISRRGESRPTTPTKDELRAILDATPDRHRPLMLTAIFTGLRASEIRGLLWSDVDLKTRRIHVRRRVDEFNVFGPPKSEAGVRDIPISTALAATLREWKLACPKGELGLVFPNGAGKVESHANLLNRVVWPIQIAAGVIRTKAGRGKLDGGAPAVTGKYSLHAFRHAAAALWIEQGIGPKRIQARLGHSSIQMTFDRYGYLFESHDEDASAVEAIESRLLGTACNTAATSVEKVVQFQRLTEES